MKCCEYGPWPSEQILDQHGENFVGDKRSSLFVPTVIDEEKKSFIRSRMSNCCLNFFYLKITPKCRQLFEQGDQKGALSFCQHVILSTWHFITLLLL
jgi:hypothetical protein